MPFIPHTESDIRDMLDAIGAKIDVGGLLEVVPTLRQLRTYLDENRSG